MVTRRTLVTAAGAAAVAAPLAGLGAARARDAAGFRFGVVADPQYAPIAPDRIRNRYHANSLWKLSEAIAAFNADPEIRFVVTLGDVIDRGWESFSHILPLYDALEHEAVFVLGNHDHEVAAEWLGSVVRAVGMPAPYHDFAAGGFRFVVLDGNDVSLFGPPPGDPRRALAQERLAALRAAGADNARTWNGSLSDAQVVWLEERLAAAARAGERVVVLCHYPVHPANLHNLWDSDRLIELVIGQPHVVAWLGGHNHAGGYGEVDGVHFVTFRGMVDTPTTTAYAIVEVLPDRIEIRGFGREESRTLPLRSR